MLVSHINNLLIYITRIYNINISVSKKNLRIYSTVLSFLVPSGSSFQFIPPLGLSVNLVI